MTTRNRIQVGDGDARHGSVNGYANHKCRCDACTGAWRVGHYNYMHADPERLKRQASRERARRG